MKTIFKKLLQSEKVLAISGLIFMVTVGAAFAIDNNGDSDLDGVPDSVDMCSGTVPDQSSDWGVNRYLWFGGDSNFFVVNGPDGNKVLSEYSNAQTKGCSCADILKTRNGSDNAAQFKSGCSKGTLEEWIKKVNK